ncbi:nitrous oxide reductase family maturation protein NosD [Sulfurimonas sp.]|uniref:nitrous oxide reductase family maturation protein NosD n=1 Tax=Sulfurimonas sp. TaxID=2022749 RepID=UPI0039EF66A1
MLCLFYFIFSSFLDANILQDAIDNAPEGSILRLPAGIYKGNISITKPLTIIGKEDGVVIDAEGKGTVITIKSSYVTIKNLRITNSGDRHENLDSAISIAEGKHCEISNCVIDDCLFGIDMQMVSNSIISNNKITSKDLDLGLRGDGLRLWYSNDNIIKNNSLVKSRDMVVWYSHGNEIVDNSGEHGRYSLHFMHAGKNIVKNNHYKFNSVGIFFMYSKDTIATGNTVRSSLGATGMGIGLKDVSNFTLKDNSIIYCAQGIYIDRSPFEPDAKNWLIGNKFLYNAEAIHFHSLSENNILKIMLF